MFDETVNLEGQLNCRSWLCSYVLVNYWPWSIVLQFHTHINCLNQRPEREREREHWESTERLQASVHMAQNTVQRGGIMLQCPSSRPTANKLICEKGFHSSKEGLQKQMSGVKMQTHYSGVRASFEFIFSIWNKIITFLSETVQSVSLGFFWVFFTEYLHTRNFYYYSGPWSIAGVTFQDRLW